MDKKYILPEDNAPKMASEPVAVYAIPQEQTVMDNRIANVFETKRADDKQLSVTDVIFTDTHSPRIF